MNRFTQKLLFLLSISTTINHPSDSARTLDPRHTDQSHDDGPYTITFLMNNVLVTGSSTSSPTPGKGGYPPSPETHFPKPEDTPTPTLHSPSTNWLPFLSNLQALESGRVAVIEEELACGRQLGKMHGIYVTGSEDDGGHMMALRAAFPNGGGRQEGDSLRFFGIHQPGRTESHIAVIGGSGRYHGANGFAVAKVVRSQGGGLNGELLFTVYLK